MAGWIFALSLTVLVCGAVVFFAKLPRQLWVLPAAAGTLALAGYAYQGKPNVKSALAVPVAANADVVEELILIRSEMDYQFGRAKPFLITSDAAARKGDHNLSAAFLHNGLRKYPNDAELWGALGVQLMLASEGRITAPAKLAFDKSRKLWPKGPVPDYFEGLAALFDARPKDARALWTKALKNSRPNAKWRPKLEAQLSSLEQIIQ